MNDNSDLMNLPKETLQFLGLIDENGNVVKEELDTGASMTQTFAEPTQKMGIVKPSIKKGMEDIESDEDEELADSLHGKKKLHARTVKKESMGGFGTSESMFDTISKWPVARVEGFECLLAEDDEDFERFIVDVQGKSEIEFTVFSDGTVRAVSADGLSISEYSYCEDGDVESFIKRKILELASVVMFGDIVVQEGMEQEGSMKRSDSGDRRSIIGTGKGKVEENGNGRRTIKNNGREGVHGKAPVLKKETERHNCVIPKFRSKR